MSAKKVNIRSKYGSFMVGDKTTDEEASRDEQGVSRRGYLKGVTTAAVASTLGIGSLTAASGTASAAVSRSSYTIRTGTSEETTVYVIDADEAGPTAMVVGGIHGDEEAGYRSANKIKDWSIDRGKLVVLPEANKEAIANNSRTYNGGVDLNRAFPSGASPETALAQDIWDVVVNEDIDFLWDLHSSSGRYKGGGSEQTGVGQGIFSTQAGDAHRHRVEDLQPYLNDHFVQDPENDFTGATSTDGTRDMLKHKVGADLNTPAVIFETYRGLADWRQEMFTTTAVQQFLQDEGMLDENASYDGDGVAINTPEDSNSQQSGLEFGLTNDFGQDLTITEVEITPQNSAADQLRDHTYEEGKWDSELWIDADVQNGLTDVHNGLTLPGTIDLSADGHSDSADKEAILSGGSSATAYFYQFKKNGSPVDLVGETISFTLRYELADGTRGLSTFDVTPGADLEYTGDAIPVNTPEDENVKSSGVEFTIANNGGSDLTVQNMTISPQNSAADQLRDHTYQESKWNSELVIDADVQDGLCDVNNGLTLPGTIDLSADGHSDSADKEAILSDGSTATVYLYQFKKDGSPTELNGDDVDITIDYSLASGGSGSRTFTLEL